MRYPAILLFASALAFGQDPTLIRSLKFEHFKKVPVTEILGRLNEREARLMVERPYDPEDAEQARRYIAELLAEKGKPNARIEVATRVVAPKRVEVRFKLLN